jgi:Fungal protein kinase
MSAKRPPGDRSYIPAPQLQAFLQKELEGNVFTLFPEVLLQSVWPESGLPYPLNMDIFKPFIFNKIWDNNRHCFTTFPKSISEVHMAEWLNTLGGMIGSFFNIGFPRRRSWSPGTCNKQPDGADINRKPDLVLVDRCFVDPTPDKTPPHISWTLIHAFAEVTRSFPLPKRITSSINDKSYVIFSSQHDRRFVPALTFNGHAEFSVTFTDRQGQLSTPFISFLQGRGNVLYFMKILAFLMYGPLHHTGRDTTMELGEDGRVKAILVNGNQYEVEYLIYSMQSMIGRGTTIWLVSRNGYYYILKDSWIQTSRVGSEIDFLEKLKDDPILLGHVPQIVEGEDVRIQVGGFVDFTGRYRTYVGESDEARTHRRLVMSPIGKRINSFQSTKELIHALIDIIKSDWISSTFSSNIVNISSRTPI